MTRWLLLDRTIAAPVRGLLEERGFRCIHASEEELATADARELLESAIDDECLVVSRNRVDFLALATAFGAAGRSFPGIVLLAGDPAPAREDAGRIAKWLDSGGAEGVEDRVVWLDEDD